MGSGTAAHGANSTQPPGGRSRPSGVHDGGSDTRIARMAEELLISSTGSPETSLRLLASPGPELDVDLQVRGMTARTHVDARGSASTGWEHADPGLVLDP